MPPPQWLIELKRVDCVVHVLSQSAQRNDLRRQTPTASVFALFTIPKPTWEMVGLDVPAQN